MKPILFTENSTDFTTNGIGRLSDAISCVVREERNGQYELEMVYPESGAHFSEIAIRGIIVAKPSANSSVQPFRIYKISRPINGKVTIEAQHISYDLTKNVTMPFSVTASASACNLTLQNLKSHAVEACPFSFTTDVTTVASYTQTVPGSIRSRLGGVAGSVLDQFGGEYEWDGYTVKLYRDRGTTRDITLRYGKNITDLEQEENIANTVTGVVPYWTNMDGDQVITLPERVVRSSHASEYSSFLTVPLDLSSEWDEAPTVEALRAAATVYVNKQGFGVPKVSTTVSFVNLADTEEYKDLIPLQNVSLCDTITVQFEKLGIDTTAKIVKTVYNVLKEKYDELQVGSLKSNLASTITDMEASTVQSISDTGKRVFAEANTEAQDLVNNATAWLTSSGGYVIAVKNQDGSWKELLFMDTNDITTAHNVLRINENGLGFSSTGIGGPYTQAWTLDGKLVVGGTNVPSITCYDSNNNIIFQASATGAIFNSGVITLRDANRNLVFQASSSGIIWNATNSQMDQDGTLTASNAKLTGGLIKLGGSANGKLEIYTSGGVKSGEWTRDHFLVQSTSQSSRNVEIADSLTGTAIKFDNNTAQINGASNGLRIDAGTLELSSNYINITNKGSSGTTYSGYNGDVVTSVGDGSISNVCCDLSISLTSDGRVSNYSFNNVSFGFLNSHSTHAVKKGLVVS